MIVFSIYSFQFSFKKKSFQVEKGKFPRNTQNVVWNRLCSQSAKLLFQTIISRVKKSINRYLICHCKRMSFTLTIISTTMNVNLKQISDIVWNLFNSELILKAIHKKTKMKLKMKYFQIIT